jgi:hypothetical protein
VAVWLGLDANEQRNSWPMVSKNLKRLSPLSISGAHMNIRQTNAAAGRAATWVRLPALALSCCNWK